MSGGEGPAPAPRLITPRAAEWPHHLDHLGPHARPQHLYVEGRDLDPVTPCVAVVGTRRPTGAGIEIAERIARELAEAGMTVVSGLAVGIDAAAHRAALTAGGHTIAVLGCGLDIPYPKRNLPLKDAIRRSGTLVTEHPQGTQPTKAYFPLRNRIIAGLSGGVVVIEGAITSGALVTARLAIDCDRSVYAVPGSVRNPMAEGPNELIRSSQAMLVTCAKHIFDDLAPSLVWRDSMDGRAKDKPQLTLHEAAMMRALDDAPLPLDHLCRALDMKPGLVASCLSQLEIRGLVVRTRAGYALSGRHRAP